MHGLLTDRHDEEAQAPLKYFHRWIKLSKPNEFDKPTKQEWTLVGIGVLLAPLVVAFGSVWFFFQPEFLEMRRGKRVLFALAMPFLLLPAYCYVIGADVVLPLFRRIRLRARMMREAGRAVRELVKDVL